MSSRFDQTHNRRNTYSLKWDKTGELFGDPELLPLWVADMDFESPPAVKKALLDRAQHGIYGYTTKSEQYTEAIMNWFRTRHGWNIEPSSLVDVPGVVTSLSLCVDLFSEPDSPVILQSPVYYPFYDVIRMNGRKVAANPLLLQNGRYEMDFDHLESLMKDGAKLMLLCSPHNPGGRVWERDVLQRLGELCEKYDVTIVSDEIHADLVLPGHQHTPIATISEALARRTITCLAPTKTFNLPGLHCSFVVIPNPEMKRRFEHRIKTLSLHMMHFFNNDAIIAAYTEGGPWLDEMLQYVSGNIDYAIEYLAEHLPEVIPMRPEGSYLLWIDCRGLDKDVDGLKKLMFQDAKVAFNEGSVYGPEGAGYLRINLACPRSVVAEALQRFCTAALDGSPRQA